MNSDSSRLVPASNPEVMELLGAASVRVVYRLAREKHVPHIRLNRSIKFSIPVLRAWIAEKAMASCSASAGQE